MIRPYQNMRVIVWVLTLLIFLGCTPLIKQEPPALAGTFTGSTPDGRPIAVTLTQDENTVTGQGQMGDRVFGLSALVSFCGPAILMFRDGSVSTGNLTLSPDGATATVHGIGEPFTLQRGGETVGTPSGSFAGRYSTTGPPPLWLSLTQGGDMLAGIGFMNGKPVAVVGRTTGPMTATGSILFSDESQARVTVTLTEDAKILTVNGLGGPVTMMRQ